MAIGLGAVAALWFVFSRQTPPPPSAAVATSPALALADRVQGALRRSAAAGSASLLPASAPALAVLPFEAPEGDEVLSALAGSMCEALAEHLGRGELPAASACHSVRMARQIGLTPAETARLLGVRALLAGRVERDGDRVRVSARLLEPAAAPAGAAPPSGWEAAAQSARELWRHEASHDTQRLADLPVHLVRRIAEHDRGRAGTAVPGMPVPPGEAYALYLQAMQLQRRGGGVQALQRARALLDQALALAPEHPPMLMASVALNSQLVAHGVGSGAAVDAQVRETALTLQRVDPEGPQTASVNGGANVGRRQWQQAFEDLERAAARHPRHAPLLHTRGGILLMMGYLARGRESALRSALVEPLNASVHERLARAASLLGEDAAMREAAALTRELGRPAMAAPYEAWAALRGGDAAQAELHWREVLASARLPQDWIGAALRAHAAPADAAARATAVAAIDALGAEVQRRMNHAFLAHALAGDTERAMRALERTRGDVPTMWMTDLWLPELAALRRHERFVPYLREMGLVALWEAHGEPERCRRDGGAGPWQCD
ncbi:MAG: hypothetical protein JNJ89_00580 [Rubrivivax sp.]|nr:hypothetical protein [Rubrivivax sp.]